MKEIRPYVSGLIVCGIVLALTTSLSAQNPQQGIAKVVNKKGAARYYLSGDPTPHPLEVGMILKPGTVVQTASGSYVDLVLNNEHATEAATSSGGGAPAASLMNANNRYQAKVEQDAVRINESTVLGLNKLTVTQTGADRVTETELDLKAGRIFGTVKKLTAGSTYQVKIPNGVAGIRGTIYFISADGEVSVLSSLADLSRLVPSGSVVLAYVGPDGNVITQVVGDGQHFDTRTGQLTPIDDSVRQNMIDWAQALQVAPAGQFVEFVVDHTIYYLSPITDQGGSFTASAR